jgi:stage III sporulation protein AA
MFHGLISGRIERALSHYDEGAITEIRLRKGRPLVVSMGKTQERVRADGGFYVVTEDDVERVLGVATDHSLYAVNHQLVEGYLTKGGVRIGVAGRGVMDGECLVTIKDVTSIVLRIPHSVTGCADKIVPQVFTDGVKSTLIISPPGAGKTTLLRDLARQASATYATLVLDERFEFGGVDGSLDLGESDVIRGMKKAVSYTFGLRSLSPEIVVTDEIFGGEEIKAIKDVVRAGVKVFASVHGKSLDGLRRDAEFSKLLDCFEVFVTLAPVGKIISVDYE